MTPQIERKAIFATVDVHDDTFETLILKRLVQVWLYKNFSQKLKLRVTTVVRPWYKYGYCVCVFCYRIYYVNTYTYTVQPLLKRYNDVLMIKMMGR